MAFDDPWAQVEDLDGNQLYETLGVSRRATQAELRSAFRAAARTRHPDKGGDARTFAALRQAFEVLSDPASRAAYDELASQLRYRFIPGVTHRAPGGEAALLAELARLGLACEAATQLVCVCEVCSRPATKTCYVCSLLFCEFCTRKPHWKGKFGLHYPVHNSPHMEETLGRKQLERKRIEDAERMMAAAPQWRSESELREARAFKDAAAAARGAVSTSASLAAEAQDFRLTRYYMWAQSAEFVFLAVHVPTAFSDRALRWSVTGGECRVQAEDSMAVVARAWAHGVDEGWPVEALVSDDNRGLALALRKATPGEPWRCVFQGDSDGYRALQPPYRLAEGADDVLLEWPVPSGVTSADLTVDITPQGIAIALPRHHATLRRRFWADAEAAGRTMPGQAASSIVDADACTWALRDAAGDDGASGRLLSVLLVKPPLTKDEVQYKKGVRDDNRSAPHPGRPGIKGARFFEDDADPFDLEPVLQAYCFVGQGWTYAPPAPEAQHGPRRAGGHVAVREEQLGESARRHLASLLRARGEGAEGALGVDASPATPGRLRA